MATKDSVKIIDTIPEHLAVRARETPDRLWLKDRRGDDYTTWTWSQAHNEVNAAAAWLETHYGKRQSVFGILSRNRAHWMLADMAITASGHVSAPLFTTLLADTAEYILSFTEASALIVGEAGNWESVKRCCPKALTSLHCPALTLCRT